MWCFAVIFYAVFVAVPFDAAVAFDSEANKDAEEIDKLENTSYIQDAFIFCPMMGSVVLN